jgi:hypothetical protein
LSFCGGFNHSRVQFVEQGEEGGAVGELFNSSDERHEGSDVGVEPVEEGGEGRVLGGKLLHISKGIIINK